MTQQAETSTQRQSGMSVFSARRHETFEALEPIWRQFESEGLATAFQHFEWLKGVRDYLARPANGTPFVVEVRDAASGRTLLLLPFILLKKAGYKVIEYLSLDVCDISAPLVAPGYVFPETAGAALWNALLSVFPQADIVDIRQISVAIGGHHNPLAQLPGAYPIAMKSFDVAITGDPATIVERIANRQTRRILKTSARRMAEFGEVRFLHVATQPELDILWPTMIAQRLERFRQLERFDLLSRPEVQAFYKDTASAALTRDEGAHVFGLSVDGECIATAYGLVHGGALHLIIVTMAEGKWRSCSPGMAIIAGMIRWAREQDLTLMDFSIGELAYKTGFGGVPRDLVAVVQPLTAKGRCVRIALEMRLKLIEAIKSRPRLFHLLRHVYLWLKKR